jgi:hypothetical protein
MNTTLALSRSLGRDEQRLHADALSHRLSPIDRLSLRLGLWLLLRSTRGLHDRRDHEGHERARRVQRARDARDTSGYEHLLRAHHS